ncbi:putative sin3 component histone deacetylase complex protein [Botrytis fragariae]|uniref:Putative sin3 component histone deacetylase complex protein n=1 Tax=Botrytis fragariae TaxID=1964551 RepID=A0A8H6EJ46_9HELO|nr:putative sin3 component histone deacetylase complex protein [Botrytis fragariae]KAF5874141.1 putative sin3 component histone deacetylase complex protein [Botrytis fragariae]
METNALQANQPGLLLETQEFTVCFAIQSYLHTLKNQFQDEPQIYEQFIGIIQNFHEDEEMPRDDLEATVGQILQGHDDLIQEYQRIRILFDEREDFELARKQVEEEKKEALRNIASAERQAAHIRACEAQSKSTLLRLPREIRDAIWKDVAQGNIVHISRIDVEDASSSSSTSFKYHSCVAITGLKSSACPAGEGDHALCARTSRSDFPSYRLVCKQMNLELPEARTTFFAENALHFDNVEDAEMFIFALKERDRSTITHVRLPVPYSLAMNDYSDGMEFRAWEAIMNYFSCPWVRSTLHLNEDDSRFLKRPWYFYYSSCYYHENRDRMYKKWQVGFGDTSWDVDIASLRHKSEPRIDIGMSYPEYAQSTLFRLRPRNHIPFTTQFDNPPPWLRSLLQFRQYSGLNFHFWASNPTSKECGIVRVPRHEAFIEALQEEVSHSEIGPWKLVQFRRKPFGNPDRASLRNL